MVPSTPTSPSAPGRWRATTPPGLPTRRGRHDDDSSATARTHQGLRRPRHRGRPTQRVSGLQRRHRLSEQTRPELHLRGLRAEGLQSPGQAPLHGCDRRHRVLPGHGDGCRRGSGRWGGDSLGRRLEPRLSQRRHRHRPADGRARQGLDDPRKHLGVPLLRSQSAKHRHLRCRAGQAHRAHSLPAPARPSGLPGRSRSRSGRPWTSTAAPSGTSTASTSSPTAWAVSSWCGR